MKDVVVRYYFTCITWDGCKDMFFGSSAVKEKLNQPRN